jgi:hypothetical protein
VNLARIARRTLGLAVAVGAVAALDQRRPSAIAPVTLLALWPSLGGHFIKLAFRNRVLPRLGAAGPVAFRARLGWLFAGGALLHACARATLRALAGRGA